MLTEQESQSPQIGASFRSSRAPARPTAYVSLSQSPQIGASFRRDSPSSRASLPWLSLNPLKSGRPSGVVRMDENEVNQWLSLNPLKSGRPSGAAKHRAVDEGLNLSQSPQIGASFRRLPAPLDIRRVREGLNPLKSGRPSGAHALNLMPEGPDGSQSPQIGASFRSRQDEVERVRLRRRLNPLKSGRPSGVCEKLVSSGAPAQVSIPSNRGVLPESYLLRDIPAELWVSIPSNRGVLPEFTGVCVACNNRSSLNPLKSGRPSGVKR